MTPVPSVIAVCGAGTMGAGIAQLAAAAGARVLVHDPQPGAVERGIDGVRDALAKRVARGRAAREDVDASERAWWQEVTGALIARGRSGGPGRVDDLGVSGSGLGGAENG